MDFTQAQLHESNAFLNKHAVQIKGTDVGLYIHYWGGELVLYDNVLHKHSFYEVCYIEDGEGVYSENGKEYPLHKGVLFVSRPHIRHRIQSEKGLHIIFVAFELLESESSAFAIKRFQSFAKTDRFHITDAAASPAIQLWKSLLTLVLQRPAFVKDTIEALSIALLTSLENEFNISQGIPPAYLNQQVVRASTTICHRAKLYILDNLSQPLRLQNVADYLHISPRHLSRLFTEELGMTFTNFVRKERVAQAATLLSAGRLSIKKIAEDTGFDTVHYFSSVFKAEMGVTPGEFNKKLNYS
ncbi:AraC family transcriptional regulator [Paenibacillus montanisoli]|uniref:AraC family transcriptional regulator n=1 Tax=Paenibacillus montanisoli TaxID=2081970 RepID=UPI0014028CC4|nr:AraC family transcriptional regulator [Paenibacillus montanisoli]